MRLLGIVGKETLYVRTGAANGSGWGCTVQNEANSWHLALYRGGGGAVAVHHASDRWTFVTSARPAPREEARLRGDTVIVALSPTGARPYVKQGEPWVFAYEGTIASADALRDALDPRCATNPGLLSPGDLIFTHVLIQLAGIGAVSNSDLAMQRATADVRRARRRGAIAFLCSDGERSYAYAHGRPLVLSSLADALLIGSPELVPKGPGVRAVANGALVSLRRRPHLDWSITADGDD